MVRKVVYPILAKSTVCSELSQVHSSRPGPDWPHGGLARSRLGSGGGGASDTRITQNPTRLTNVQLDQIEQDEFSLAAKL